MRMKRLAISWQYPRMEACSLQLEAGGSRSPASCAMSKSLSFHKPFLHASATILAYNAWILHSISGNKELFHLLSVGDYFLLYRRWLRLGIIRDRAVRSEYWPCAGDWGQPHHLVLSRGKWLYWDLRVHHQSKYVPRPRPGMLMEHWLWGNDQGTCSL